MDTPSESVRKKCLTPLSGWDSGHAGVDLLGLFGDAVPAEHGIHRGAAIAAHPATAIVVRQERAETPGDGIRRVVDLQAVDSMPDELGRTAALGADDRL